MGRRMFTEEITESDAFYDLSPSSQALYLHLCMNADDDGFVNTARRIVRLMGIAEENLRELVLNRFLIEFEDSIYCIKHWKVHNKIRPDRKKMTTYQDELDTLITKKNGAYSQKINDSRTVCGQLTDSLRAVDGQFAGNSPHRLVKGSLVQDSLGEFSGTRAREGAATTAYGIYKNVLLTKEQIEDLRNRYPDHWENRIDKFSTYLHQSNKTYVCHYDKIIQFATNDNVPTTASKEKSFDADEFFTAASERGRTMG